MFLLIQKEKKNSLKNSLFKSSVQFSHSVMSDSLRPHELQHTRPPCPSPTPGVHPDSLPSSQWYHPAISSSVVPFSSCSQSLPASESFPMSQLFAWGGQSTGVSALASFLPKKSQGWSSSEWTGWKSQQFHYLFLFQNIHISSGLETSTLGKICKNHLQSHLSSTTASIILICFPPLFFPPHPLLFLPI